MPSTLEPTSTQCSPRAAMDEEAAVSMLQLLRDGADVRTRKVQHRAAVRVKAYENPLKLSVAIDRLIAVLES